MSKLKKIIICILLLLITIPVMAKTDRSSEEYLKNSFHITPMTPLAENFAQTVIKSVLKKETGRNFKVKFSAYNLSSMKKGIFKSMDISGKDVNIKGLNLEYLHLKTISDYNWIDYTNKNPIFKTDIKCAYEIGISEKTINSALELPQYKNILESVNEKAYPLFYIHDVRVKIKNNKMKIAIEYNFPIAPKNKNKFFAVSTDFYIKNGKIFAKDIQIEKRYGNLSANKVKNLINLLNPLEYLLSFMNPTNCNFTIENVNIVDDIIQIDGNILIKGEQT